MSLSIKIILIIAGIILASVLLLGMCHNFTTRGEPGQSASMEESKERGVFVAHLIPENNPVTISITNSTLTVPIHEAWIERRWNYGVIPTETSVVKLSGIADYCLLIKIPEEQWKEGFDQLNKTWQIHTGKQKYISKIRGNTVYLLSGYMDSISSDTVVFTVTAKTNVHDPSPPVLDTFTFKVEYEE